VKRLLILAALVAACGGESPTATMQEERPSAEGYQLVAVNGAPLPFTMDTGTQVLSSSWRLDPDGTFVRVDRRIRSDGYNELTQTGRWTLSASGSTLRIVYSDNGTQHAEWKGDGFQFVFRGASYRYTK
jgi:hypothetical protein